MENGKYCATIGGEEFYFNGITRVSTRVEPFTFWEIRKIFDVYYHISMDNMWQGYKANRRPNYREIYRLVNIDTGKIVAERVDLRVLRKFLTDAGFKHNPPVERNIGAENWLYIVELITGKKLT